MLVLALVRASECELLDYCSYALTHRKFSGKQLRRSNRESERERDTQETCGSPSVYRGGRLRTWRRPVAGRTVSEACDARASNLQHTAAAQIGSTFAIFDHFAIRSQIFVR